MIPRYLLDILQPRPGWRIGWSDSTPSPRRRRENLPNTDCRAILTEIHRGIVSMAAGNSLLAVAPKTPLEEDAAIKHRVVVLGGGFAGVYTAKYLTRMLGNRRDVHVELLSEENYFVFQPL